MHSTHQSPAASPDLALFGTTSHSPSFASLTGHFERVGNLKDYCIPVNSYPGTPQHNHLPL